jgi:hypothetical protein
MQTHIKVLGILHIVMGALFLLGGLIGASIMGGLAGVVAMEGGHDGAVAVPMFGALGGIILIACLLLSIPGIIAGIGLLNYKNWARILAIVLSALNLLNFPFGTALGVYGFWVLFAPETVALFEGQRRVSAY